MEIPPDILEASDPVGLIVYAAIMALFLGSVALATHQASVVNDRVEAKARQTAQRSSVTNG
jgi:hypothetical protein